ncbi:MAG: 4-(cytidine 5'-diphospho)-2-C-methyl-D-erythritol kinase [Atopobiaceae bacterium]|nr:4-(cytidine 5'-diphospho)-2-C-methyl-D-erythritol kinase [Atopobiaceae bacterium]MBR1829156.1 4-(cytidine 5'-diphospho)-2-C-methyl-D-erythritol kinase [Atopobiaceae bacterium]
MARIISLAAHAKVNLHLGIYEGRDERGYHRADSIMIAVDLHDRVTVTSSDEYPIVVNTTPELDVPERRTLVARSARALAAAFGINTGAQIDVVRHIPDKSGLGSASTDAATTIRALCMLWCISEKDPRVVEVARRAGADMAFFLNPVPSLLVGVGDQLKETFPPLPDVPIVLVRPTGGVSTPEAYAEFDRVPTAPASPTPMCKALRESNIDAVAKNLFNNLEPPACRLEPEERAVIDWLRAQNGVRAAQVTGSGSCTFGICESHDVAERVAAAALARNWWACATKTI